MTHPLSEELRKLAASGIALGGTKDTLRRAADALDACERSISGHVAMGKLLTAKCDVLRQQLLELTDFVNALREPETADAATTK